MSVIKRCRETGCTKAPRCDHDWTLVCYAKNVRYRVELLKFAAPRMAQGEAAPSTKAEAERWDLKFALWVHAGRPVLVDASGAARAADAVTVRVGVATYAKKYVTSELNCKATPSILKRIDADFGTRAITDLYDRGIVKEFRDDLAEECSKSTANAYMKRLSHLLNWWRAEFGVKGDSPWYHHVTNRQGVKKFTGLVGRSRRLEAGEEAALVKTFDAIKDGAMMRGRFYAALDGCMRRGEMLKIEKTDVDWLREKANGGLLITLRAANTKSGKDRTIPVTTKRLREFLKARRLMAFPFGQADGTRVDDFRQSWAEMLETAGLEAWTYEKRAWGLAPVKTKDADLNWHDLRHEGASRLAEGYYGGEKMTVPEIQKLLGHADIKTTMIYLNIKDLGFAQSMRAATPGL